MPRQLGTTLEVDDGIVRIGRARGVGRSGSASLLCGLAWSPAALLAARVVQGAGAAIMTATALSIISTTFTEGSERNNTALQTGTALGVAIATTVAVSAPSATWQRTTARTRSPR